jgi:hypothetical protein
MEPVTDLGGRLVPAAELAAGNTQIYADKNQNCFVQSAFIRVNPRLVDLT